MASINNADDPGFKMTCRLCSGEDIHYKYTAKGFKLYKCRRCGFLQVMPLPGEEELEPIYSNDYFTHSKYKDINTLNREHKRRLKLLTDFFPAEETAAGSINILDYGCAAGDFIEYVQDHLPYFMMWGVDLSAFAITAARQKLPDSAERLCSGTLENNHFEPGFFDAATLWDVIEHIPDPLDLLNRLFAIIKPGGYIFISTPDAEALTAKIFGKYWAFMTPPEHLGFFSLKSFKYLFKTKLNGEIIKRVNKGKWVNVGFLFYKLKRIFPRLIPGFIVRFFDLRLARRWALYAPTCDIQYLVIARGTASPT